VYDYIIYIFYIRSECAEDEGTDCESGHSDTGKGGQNLTCSVY